MFNVDGSMQQQLSMSPQIASADQSTVTRFAGQALGEPRAQPLEVKIGSKKDLNNPQLGMIRSRGTIQSNLAGATRGLKDRRAIQANQTPGGDLEPTTLEGFGS